MAGMCVRCLLCIIVVGVVVVVGVAIAIYLRFSDKLNSVQARRRKCFFNLFLCTRTLSSSYYSHLHLFGITAK